MGPPSDGALLEVDRLEAGYDGRLVVFAASLEVRAGEIVAVLGHNGAGKTTTLKAIFGLLTPAGGSVRLDGGEVSGLAPVEHARQGMTYIPAEHFVFQDLSVADNLALASMHERSEERREAHRRRVASLFPILEERRDQTARTMSGGEQRMLSIGMALMAGPRLLLLDEPSLGLSPVFVERIMDAVRDLADELGIGVLLLEQNIGQALRIADRAYVMRSGEIIAEGGGEELRQRADWWELF